MLEAGATLAPQTPSSSTTAPAPATLALSAPALPPPLLVGAAATAKLLGISRALLYSMHADGRLGPLPVSFGRRKLWRVSELTAWTEHSPPCPPRAEWMKERWR